jgi:hypothetical protein
MGYAGRAADNYCQAARRRRSIDQNLSLDSLSPASRRASFRESGTQERQPSSAPELEMQAMGGPLKLNRRMLLAFTGALVGASIPQPARAAAAQPERRNVLKDLYDSKINFSIETCWHGMTVKLGHANRAEAVASIDEWEDAERWLAEQAIQRYPQSRFALMYRDGLSEAEADASLRLKSAVLAKAMALDM